MNDQPTMKESEVAAILTKIIDYDGRIIAPETMPRTVAAWQECIGHLPYGKTLAAVTTWYMANEKRIMPANLIRLVTEDEIPDCWR